MNGQNQTDVNFEESTEEEEGIDEESLKHRAMKLIFHASNVQQEIEGMLAQKQEILDTTWKEEKEKLLQSLEEEKDKISTWQEERDELYIKLANYEKENEEMSEKIKDLEKAVLETSWATEREVLLKTKEELILKVNESINRRLNK